MEVWKDIKGYEGKYQVSTMGRVWSIKRQIYLKPCSDKDGYLKVSLVAINGKVKVEKIHRLVALTFIDNPNNHTVVNHIDSCRQNNWVGNLEWTTVRGNNEHGYEHGSIKKSQQIATEAARLINSKACLVYKEGELMGEYPSIVAAAAACGVSEKTARLCIKEKRSTRSGYSFATKGVI